MILHTLLEYDVLRVVWWLLLGVLLVAFAITDGFDLGTGTLLPFVARTDLERRVVINTIGPVWEGNQVWLVLGGGAIFAAWPLLYAVSFSGFYLAMAAILLALILRPVGFKYRSKHTSARWRANWDWALFAGGFVPSLIFGVAMGNVLQGVPFRLTPELQIFYEGSFFGLLNPFALLCGLVSVAMLVMHGASWLVLKTGGTVARRARVIGAWSAVAVLVLFPLAGALLWAYVDGFRITSALVANGASNPLFKSVEAHANGAWFANYAAHPWTLAAPLAGLGGSLLTLLGLGRRWEKSTMLFSSLSIAGIVLSVGASMFPFILPSSIQPQASLTVWDASSSQLTLFIMLVCACVFLPIIIAYTSWVYKVLWGKVDPTSISDGKSHAY
jgi:cytochrome d ubiquinol oxidase subunit II